MHLPTHNGMNATDFISAKIISQFSECDWDQYALNPNHCPEAVYQLTMAIKLEFTILHVEQWFIERVCNIVFKSMGLEVDRESESNRVKVWLTARDRHQGRPKVSMKLGKLLNRVVVNITNTQIESILDRVANLFVNPASSRYAFISGNSVAFLTDIAMKKVARGFSTYGSHYASLYASCMQQDSPPRDRHGKIVHPYAAYATEDFICYALVDTENGKLMARCIANAQEPHSCAQVYSVNRNFGDELLSRISETTGKSADESFEPVGCELLQQPIDNYTFAVPYVDGCNGLEFCGRDRFAILCDRDICDNVFTSSGVVTRDDILSFGECGYENMHECYNCGERVEDDDIAHDYYSNAICMRCLHNYYVYSEDLNEYLAEDDAYDYFCRAGSCGDGVNVYCDSVYTTESQRNEHAFRCEESGDWWANEYMVTTVCGSDVSEYSADVVNIGKDYYILNSDEYWQKRLEMQPNLSRK